jgi:hypothetical protein
MYVSVNPKLSSRVSQIPMGESTEGNNYGVNTSKKVSPKKLVIAGVLLLLVPLIAVLLYEPSRFRAWADDLSPAWVSTTVTFVLDKVEAVHYRLGLNKYKKEEAEYLADVKETPTVLSAENDSDSSGLDTYDNSQEADTSESEDNTPQEHQKLEPPYRVLIVGDSLILEGFGPILDETLRTYPAVSIKRDGHYSTGLTRPDYYDWNARINELLDSYQPNVVIIMFGANDGQGIISSVNGKAITFDTAGWSEEYALRADHFMDLLDEHGVLGVWVGNPIAKSDYYSHKMEVINGAVEAAIPEHPNIHFVSTWEVLKDASGNYSDYLPDASGQMQKARAQDGIHCTEFGGSLMVDYVIEQMKSWMELEL